LQRTDEIKWKSDLSTPSLVRISYVGGPACKGELKPIGHYAMGMQPNWIEIVDLT